MIMLEREFRQKVCFAVMPGSCHWDEVEQVHRRTAWMVRGWVYEEGLREPGSFRRLREKITVFVSLLVGYREDGPRLFSEVHGKRTGANTVTACDTASSDEI